MNDALSKTPAMPEAKQTAAILPEGSQDWQLLVTDGHVRGHRIEALRKMFMVPALISGVIGAFLCYQTVSGALQGPALLPQAVVRFLSYDPSTYVSAPAVADHGLDYRVAWLADLKPERGLDAKGWSDLVRAAGADLTAHYDKTDDYAAIPKLAAAPTVTRPAKAISEHVADLTSGVIAIPPQPQPGQSILPTHVLAWVQGKLAWAVMVPGRQPGILFGPVPDGMQQVPAYGATPELLNQLKPGAVK
jgi:hypothetical protein